MLRGQDVSRDRLEAGYAELEAQAREEMESEGMGLARALAQRSLDVRYVGQGYELAIDHPRRGRAVDRAIATAFHKAHRQRFGYADTAEPVEVVNLRLKMVVPAEAPVLETEAEEDQGPTPAPEGEAGVVFAGGATPLPLTSGTGSGPATASRDRPWCSRWTRPR